MENNNKAGQAPIDSQIPSKPFEFEVGKVYQYPIVGFSYKKEYAFLVVNIENKHYDVILGDKHSNPIQSLVSLRGLTVKFEYTGTVEFNGKLYPRFRMNYVGF